MATRRKNPARRGRERQVGKGAPTTSKKKAAKNSKAKKADLRPKRKTAPPKKPPPKKPPPKKPPPKKPPPKKPPKRAKRPPKPSLPEAAIIGKVEVPELFKRLRTKARRAKKLPEALHPKRSGKSSLRGTHGKERDFRVDLPWENVHEAWLVHRIDEIFRKLQAEVMRKYPGEKPSLYARFTFTVTGVMTLLSGGSPKLIRATRKRVKAWFHSSDLSYTLEGASFNVEKTIDIISSNVADARRDNVDPTFFLEFVKCLAYLV